MTTQTINTLKTTSATLLKLALVAALLAGLAAAVPANLTRINATAVVLSEAHAAQV
ncbi:MAG: hypothetical protein IT492_10870 [Gammaproteobacteria bacterium]|nr:hypothetical protein [Gammaproteobacteria bacterium]